VGWTSGPPGRGEKEHRHRFRGENKFNHPERKYKEKKKDPGTSKFGKTPTCWRENRKAGEEALPLTEKMDDRKNSPGREKVGGGRLGLFRTEKQREAKTGTHNSGPQKGPTGSRLKHRKKMGSWEIKSKKLTRETSSGSKRKSRRNRVKRGYGKTEKNRDR